MAARAGLTAASFGAAERSRVRARLQEDHERRHGLPPRARAALDGIVHALDPAEMDADLPARHVLDYALDGPDGPHAVVSAGDPSTATHLTWLVSGMGISPHTAMWGTAREAAYLAAAQRAAGAPRPVVIAWLGYPAPTPWRVVLDGPGRRGGALLAADVRAWWEYLHHGPGEDGDGGAPPLRARGTAVHGAMEAHSYGSLVAAHALRLLADDGLQPDDVDAPRPAERPVETLVVSGAVGLPATLAARAGHLGLRPGRVFRALAPGDILARLGRALGLRRGWPGAVVLPVVPGPGLAGAAVRGHNTGRQPPEDQADAPRGYRDAGSVTLAATALVTAGLSLPSGLAGPSGVAPATTAPSD